MMDITKRTAEEIAEQLMNLPNDEQIKVVLHLVDEADYDFIFNLIASIYDVADFQEDFNKKQVAEMVKKAKIIKIPKYDY